MEREGESPTFAVCEAADRPEFYVRVAWPSGGETRLDRFATRRDAEGWTARKSAFWLQFHAGTRRRRQATDEERSSVAAGA